MNIFALLTAGDSASWDDAPFQDTAGRNYDSSAWSLKYEIRGPQVVTLNSVAKGTGWTTAITSAQSAALLGPLTVVTTFYWAAYATKGSERVTAGTGTLALAPDLATAGVGFDGTSQAEKDLAAVKAEITSRVGGGLTLEYTIGNRSLKKEPLTALFLLRDRLVREVRRERSAEMVANGLGNPRRVMVRFGRS